MHVKNIDQQTILVSIYRYFRDILSDDYQVK